MRVGGRRHDPDGRDDTKVKSVSFVHIYEIILKKNFRVVYFTFDKERLTKKFSRDLTRTMSTNVLLTYVSPELSIFVILQRITDLST